MLLLAANEHSIREVGFQIGGHESCVRGSQARANKHGGERWKGNGV